MGRDPGVRPSFVKRCKKSDSLPTSEIVKQAAREAELQYPYNRFLPGVWILSRSFSCYTKILLPGRKNMRAAKMILYHSIPKG
jgi:hypothetical protein